MPKVFGDFIYLLVATCKITNFLLAIPIKSRTTQVLAEAICNDCCALYDDKCLDYVSMSTFIDSAEKYVYNKCMHDYIEILFTLPYKEITLL